MKKILFILVLLSIGSFSFAGAPSMDDFMIPAENDPAKGKFAPTEIKNPGAIKVTKETKVKDGKKTSVVRAADTQDAINKAIGVQREFDEDITEIKVGSGIGIVARGNSDYSIYKNRNASLLSQREAYVKAFLKAKKNLAGYLEGLTVDAQQELVDSIDNLDTDQESLANTKTVMTETNEQKLESLLRGFVIYKVNDNPQEKEVTVHIVTTPKTRGETMMANSGAILASDFRAAMKQVLAQLKTGILPPIGSKVISVPTKNQLFFISFGSEIIRFNKNKKVMKKNKASAIRIAKMRSVAGMVGLIIGDKTSWKGRISKSADENIQQFQELEKGDPLNKESGLNFMVLEKEKDTYISRQKETQNYRSAQKGKLPAGLRARTWSDGDWAYAMHFYNPFSTKQADKLRKKMQQSPGILQRGNAINNESDQNKVETGENNKRPIQKGTSGQVSSDKDL